MFHRKSIFFFFLAGDFALGTTGSCKTYYFTGLAGEGAMIGIGFFSESCQKTRQGFKVLLSKAYTFGESLTVYSLPILTTISYRFILLFRSAQLSFLSSSSQASRSSLWLYSKALAYPSSTFLRGYMTIYLTSLGVCIWVLKRVNFQEKGYIQSWRTQLIIKDYSFRMILNQVLSELMSFISRFSRSSWQATQNVGLNFLFCYFMSYMLSTLSKYCSKSVTARLKNDSSREAFIQKGCPCRDFQNIKSKSLSVSKSRGQLLLSLVP